MIPFGGWPEHHSSAGVRDVGRKGAGLNRGFSDPDSSPVWSAPRAAVRRMSVSGAPRVLVAAEDIELADRLSDGLFDVGLDPHPAPSAAEAMSALRSERFDAVLADPWMDGWDVLREWLERSFAGLVFVAHDFDARPVSLGDAAGDADPEAAALAGRVLKAIAARAVVQAQAQVAPPRRPG